MGGRGSNISQKSVTFYLNGPKLCSGFCSTCFSRDNITFFSWKNKQIYYFQRYKLSFNLTFKFSKDVSDQRINNMICASKAFWPTAKFTNKRYDTFDEWKFEDHFGNLPESHILMFKWKFLLLIDCKNWDPKLNRKMN